ncbi:glycoside hydrolase family 28 protein [Pseudochryseolinea flava]|uniref:Exopolygalacturonase n=1 Tax=Pseudochryseolinea flava TaxID=2059302 RepID=A0A364Y5T0_9BACT|nr:glycosyl hydrolase family 28 protein [Pseudochryseolinea flava]RAW02229.1 exopolygalacturonase [Pseudochryseolinea flava]
MTLRLLTLCLFAHFTLNAQDFVITKFGVASDSTQLSTKTIQDVIDRAHEVGGGTVVIPKGVFLTGALFFKPKTNLRLEEGAVLKGSDNIDDYPLIPSRMEGRSILYYAALINAYYVDNFSVAGPGKIDGNGLKYWKKFWSHRDSLKSLGKESTNLEVHRPRLVFIWGCNNIKLQGVKLHNAGFWTTHLYQCNNILIEGCDIRAPYRPVPAPSSDGIDLDVCKKVVIRNCYISVHDDAICIKGGKGPDAHLLPQNGMIDDVLIENCTIGEAHATLTFGSECVHGRNVTMRNCKINNNSPLLKFKMRPDTYQVYENITVDNITGKVGSIINMNPWKQFFNLDGSTAKPFGTVRNITLSNINVSCNKVGDIEGNPNDVVQNFKIISSDIKAENPTLRNIYKDVTILNVTVNNKPLVLDKSKK